jgi:hypothetical protein
MREKFDSTYNSHYERNQGFGLPDDKENRALLPEFDMSVRIVGDIQENAYFLIAWKL